MSTINKSERQWTRKGADYTAELDWRMVRQALPAGAVPLMAFGGATIDGEYFTADEAQARLEACGWPAGKVVIFERAFECDFEA